MEMSSKEAEIVLKYTVEDPEENKNKSRKKRQNPWTQVQIYLSGRLGEFSAYLD